MVLKQPRIYRRKDSSFVNTETTSRQQLQDPVTNTTDGLVKDEVGVESTVANKKKYKKSALSINDLERIAGKVTALMNEERLFLTADLTMPKLASRLTISPNYLSQTINTIFEESFFDFINRQRIDYSKILLKDKSKMDNSILDIAMESAFNSKSAFYVAFKKNTGMTPVQFRLG